MQIAIVRHAPLWGMILFVSLMTACNPHRVDREVTPLVAGRSAYSLQSDGIEPRARWWEALNDSQLNVIVREALSGNLTIMQATIVPSEHFKW